MVATGRARDHRSHRRRDGRHTPPGDPCRRDRRHPASFGRTPRGRVPTRGRGRARGGRSRAPKNSFCLADRLAAVAEDARRKRTWQRRTRTETLTAGRLPMKVFRLGLILFLLLPGAAHAHRAWLLPSATVLSGTESWITVDAAISNELFYFEHHPLQLEDLTITGPDGEKITPQNPATGKYRSTFDIEMKQPGTYKLAVAGSSLFASYEQGGERKRWRGKSEDLDSEIPADAQNLKVTQSQRRLETYATLGAPSEATLKTAGEGLELAPVTHPNDLFEGEEARFKLLLDGEPASNVEVSIVRGGNRYRDSLDEIKLTTEDDGSFAVTWPEPGMYWLQASATDDKTTIDKASERRLGYVATLEVLPE